MVQVGALYASLSLNTTNFTTGLNRAQQTLKGLQANVKSVNSSMTQGMQQNGKQLTQAGKSMVEFQYKITDVGRSFTTLGNTMQQNFTKPLVNLAKSSTSVFVNFDDSVRKLGATARTTGDELQVLRDKAQALGRDTRYTASNAAEAMNYLAASGMQADEIMNTIGGTLNMAAGAGINLGDAAYITSSGLKQLGMATVEVERLTDAYSQLARSSNTTVSTVGESMQNVGTMAGSLGYSVEDIGVAIGIMGNVGIQGGKAGTGLARMLKELMTPQKGAQANMVKDLGIGLTYDDGTMKPLRVLMGDIREAFANVTDAQKVQAAELVAGSYGMSAMLAIIDADTDAYNDLIEAMDNAEGTAADMAKQMEDGLGGALRIAQSAIENMGITIGSQLEPTIRKGVEGVLKLDKSISNLTQTQVTNILKWGLILAAIGPVLSIIGKLISGVGTLISVLGKLQIGMGFLLSNPWLLVLTGIATGITAIAVSSKKATTEQIKLAEAMAEVKKLAADTTTGTSYDIDTIAGKKNVVDGKIASYEQMIAKQEQLVKEQEKLDSDYTREFDNGNEENVISIRRRSMEIVQEMERVRLQKEDLMDEIKQDYGGLEGLKEYSAAYGTRISNINNANETLAGIDDSELRALMNEVYTSQTGTNAASIDLVEYKNLTGKDKQSKADKERIKALTESLLTQLGPQIIGEDSNVSIDAAQSQIDLQTTTTGAKEGAIVDYNKVIQEGITKNKEEVSTLQAKRTMVTDLANEYGDLASKQNKTSAEQARMKAIMEKLRVECGESVVAINKDTKALEINKGEVIKNVESLDKLIDAKSSATIEMRQQGITQLKHQIEETQVFIATERAKRMAFASKYNLPSMPSIKKVENEDPLAKTQIELIKNSLDPMAKLLGNKVVTGTSQGGGVATDVVTSVTLSTPEIDAAIAELKGLNAVLEKMEASLNEAVKEEEKKGALTNDLSSYFTSSEEALNNIVYNTSTNNISITVTGNKISENVDVDKIGNTIARRLRQEGYIN